MAKVKAYRVISTYYDLYVGQIFFRSDYNSDLFEHRTLVNRICFSEYMIRELSTVFEPAYYETESGT